MKPRWTIGFAAALGVSLFSASHASAQLIAAAPAVYRGTASCASRYPGSFLDVWTGACWSCPSTHSRRTILPVGGGAACERLAHEAFRRAVGPERATGLIGTDCRKGWFFDIGRRRCYSCQGYRRTAYAVDHARACARVIPAARTRATRRGTAGCPSGSFRHGLTDRCYSCPSGYIRNAVIASDLTKVNACSQISTAVRDATREKFEEQKNAYQESRANLGRTSIAVTNYEIGQRIFDELGRSLMRTTLENELTRQSGFSTVSWLVSAGGSVGAGYSHGLGYVMTKVGGNYQCRKAWSNAFTAGLSSGGGVIIEVGLSGGGIGEGPSESNGWQIAASYPPVAAGFGLHWDAASPAMSMALTFGPGFAVDVNFSEYVHTWSENGKAVACDTMTWGPGWFNV